MKQQQLPRKPKRQHVSFLIVHHFANSGTSKSPYGSADGCSDKSSLHIMGNNLSDHSSSCGTDNMSYAEQADAYAALGQYQLAIRDYDEAIRLKPNYARAYACRGVDYIRSGNSGEGCRSLIRAWDLGICGAYEWSKQKGYCR